MKGLRWFKCDLHLHTNKSNCYRGEYSPETFIEEVKQKGIEVIAITDHNGCGNIDEIKRIASNNGITVFPGVEVTANESKVHLLILFDSDKGDIDVKRFLMTKLGVSDLEFGEDATTINKTLEEILRITKAENLIVIPAHIDDFSGISQVVDENLREKFLEDSFINSVQIVHKPSNDSGVLSKSLYAEIENTNDERSFKKISNTLNQVNKNNICKLTFSDNPSVSEISKHGKEGIGEKYSWIKMKENPDLESLRQAFIMGDSRVKNCYESVNHPYNLPNIWLEKLIFSNTELNEEEVTVNFSSQMTSIVGGRGTGKSSIVSLIRGILNKKPELEKVKVDFEKFYKLIPTSGKDKLGVLKTNSCIELYLWMDREKYKVRKNSFTLNKELENVEIYKYIEGDGWKLQENPLLLNFFDLEVYSQKEVFEIADLPNSLMKIVDLSIEALSEKRLKLKEKEYEYETTYKEIENIFEKEIEKEKLELELDIDKNKIEKIQSKEYSALLKQKKEYEISERNLKALEIGFEENYNSISEITEVHPCQMLGDESEVDTIHDNYLKKLEETIQKINGLKENLKNDKENYLEEINKSNWKNDYDILKEKVSLEEEKIQREAGTLDIEKINHRISRNTKRVEGLKKNIEMKKGLSEELEKFFGEILKIREEISNLRRDHLEETLKGLDVQIKVNPYRDQEDFEKRFRKIISREIGFGKDIDDLIIETFKGKYLTKRLEMLEKIRKVRDDERGIFDNRLNEVIKSLNSEGMAKINLLLPEDELDIKFKHNGQLKSLIKASAGQKTSAILTYILSKGNAPLILDQPEDDLDNELIYNLIVENLKKMKSKRQIIVVTHNANIPVNGDSEYVIIMDSESSTLKPKISNSIDDTNIITSICNIMEGGKSAFNFRDKKYNIIG